MQYTLEPVRRTTALNVPTQLLHDEPIHHVIHSPHHHRPPGTATLNPQPSTLNPQPSTLERPPLLEPLDPSASHNPRPSYRYEELVERLKVTVPERTRHRKLPLHSILCHKPAILHDPCRLVGRRSLLVD